jgi:hypothetical protein
LTVRPAHHSYPVSTIILTLRAVLEAAASFRASSTFSAILSSLFPQFEGSPVANTVQSWLLRIGLHELRRPKEQADDWIVFLDHTLQLGTWKCLVMIGIRQSAWQFLERPLTHADLGKPVYVPIELHARRGGIEFKFSGPLDRTLATDPARYGVRSWSLKRSANYGSEHHDERRLRIVSASLAADQCSIFLELPDIEPTWCMAIEYRLKSADGAPAVGEVENTIRHLLRRDE